jgi:hypothetical protein
LPRSLMSCGLKSGRKSKTCPEMPGKLILSDPVGLIRLE